MEPKISEPEPEAERVATTQVEQLQSELTAVLASTNTAIVTLRNGQLQRVSEAFATLLGAPAADLVGLRLRDLAVDPRAFDHHAVEAAKALQQHGRWDGEQTLRRRDGEGVAFRCHQRWVDPARPNGTIIASYTDANEGQRAQQAASRQAERTRSILDSALVGIVTVGERGIEWMNRSARRMLGGPLEQFLHQPIAVVATAQPDHPLRQAQYRLELAEGEAKTFECLIRAADGREFWVVGNAVATTDAAGGRQLTYALMDVDTRRRAGARIATAQASLQRIIEAAPLAVLLFDASRLTVLQINVVAARLANRPADQCVGLGPADLFDAGVAGTMLADLGAALRAPGVTLCEYRFGEGAAVRVWDARYTPLPGSDGQPEQVLLVATDVSEQRAAQQARLAAAIAQREMLVKEVHHRIKNNLQGVAGLLQQTAAQRPEVADILDDVVGQVQAIAEVYGLRVGAAGPLPLRQLVDSIAAAIQRLFGHRIVLADPTASPHDWALPEAEAIPLALTINELLTNAVKHSQALVAGEREPVVCNLTSSAQAVHLSIANRARLPEGFSLAGRAAGITGLALVQSLLPPRSATLRIEQEGEWVVASLLLVAPGIVRILASTAPMPAARATPW